MCCLSSTAGFLFSCVAPQCSCNFLFFSFNINCHGHLSQVPTFNRNGESRHYTVHVNLDKNQLTTIPANAFTNLYQIAIKSITIDVSNNHLYNMDVNAFGGAENVSVNIDFSNNKLTSLPTALRTLTTLFTLYFRGNPLTNLDPITMSRIGTSLTSLYLDADKFISFPNNFHYLSKLMTLQINKIPFRLLHANVFHNLQAHDLELSYSQLESIPPAVCRLSNLTALTFNFSPNLYNSSIFYDCKQRMISLIHLDLDHNHLSVFPDISNLFPNLQTLSLGNNTIHFIKSSSIATLSSLTTLDLSNNTFTRIPSAINKLTNLETLKFQHNQIDVIEDFDLHQLHNLLYIDLSSNPIAYISPDAFRYNTLLKSVDLSYTMLDRMPQAIIGLRNLATINMNGKPVECSCSAMLHMKSWNITSKSVYGSCTANESLGIYLTTKLPNCP